MLQHKHEALSWTPQLFLLLSLTCGHRFSNDIPVSELSQTSRWLQLKEKQEWAAAKSDMTLSWTSDVWDGWWGLCRMLYVLKAPRDIKIIIKCVRALKCLSAVKNFTFVTLFHYCAFLWFKRWQSECFHVFLNSVVQLPPLWWISLHTPCLILKIRKWSAKNGILWHWDFPKNKTSHFISAPFYFLHCLNPILLHLNLFSLIDFHSMPESSSRRIFVYWIFISPCRALWKKTPWAATPSV